MRAYLSKPREYDLCECPQGTHYYLGTCESVRMAELEARRILADTEPFHYSAFHVRSPYERDRDNRIIGVSEASRALAESLARWIGSAE